MKIYIDSSDIKGIKEINKTQLVDGITTNPSLIAKQNKDIKVILKEICKEIKGPVSAEVTATQAKQMIEEAKVLQKISKNIVIKLPLTFEGLKACSHLTKKGYKTNVTLCFSVTQALLAAKAGATYVSPFIGRLDDVSTDGMDLIAQIREIYDNYMFDTEILAASVRHPMHIIQCAEIGAEVMTGPLSAITALLNHPLTDIGLEKFLADFKKVNG